MISVIAALGPRRQIGKNNELIYHAKTDMAHFKEVTEGKVVIMGYNTWKSLPTPVLKNRENLVIVDFKLGVPEDIKEASEKYENLDYQDKRAFYSKDVQKYMRRDKEYVVIGGAEVYRLTQKYWQKMYLSLFNEDIEGDVSFPFYKTNGWLIRENKIHPEYRYMCFERGRKR